MRRFPVVLYRMYLAATNAALPTGLRRWPRVAGGLKRFKALLERHALPNTVVWVKSQSGLSQGMWMRLRLPDEVPHWRGTHETGVQNAIRAVVRTGAVVYDVGAHAGSFALGTARLVGELGRVVAFDGDPDNAADLRESVVRNNLGARLEVVHAAVWSYTARHGIPFRRGGIRRSQGGVEVDGQHPVIGTGEVITVPAITLDDFIADGEIAPQLVKIDVEGGEYEVLRGGATLFTKQRPLVIVEVHHQQAVEQINAWLSQQRYCARWNIPTESFPRCLFAWPMEYEGGAPDRVAQYFRGASCEESRG
jgi:FkbM family methyltransferase